MKLQNGMLLHRITLLIKTSFGNFETSINHELIFKASSKLMDIQEALLEILPKEKIKASISDRYSYASDASFYYGAPLYMFFL